MWRPVESKLNTFYINKENYEKHPLLNLTYTPTLNFQPMLSTTAHTRDILQDKRIHQYIRRVHEVE